MIRENTRTIDSDHGTARSSVLSQALVRAAGVVGFALLTAVGAHVAVPLPGTPVPMTLQTLFVLLAGMTLGPRLGLASMAFYLLLGTAGYHVFALGAWGLPTVFGVTGGYLIGFVVAQPVLGVLSRPGAVMDDEQRRLRGWPRVLAAVLAGQAVIYGCGLLWLAAWLRTGPVETLLLGLVPFLPGCAVKTAMAVVAGRWALPRLRAVFGG